MKYSICTLFPQLVTPWTEEGLLGRAVEKELISFDVYNLRDFSGNKHNKVDDTPYGGGAGMVIRVDVAARAIEAVKTDLGEPDEIILLSPAGEPLTQTMAEELATKDHLCFICGRYEGFDARVEQLVTREVSIGDYVLMGGEVAALTIVEATARLRTEVIGSEESHQQDSFSSGMLDYPEYTRPLTYEGMTVPEVLTSGNHGKVDAWRKEMAVTRTKERRPDLLEGVILTSDKKAGNKKSD